MRGESRGRLVRLSRALRWVVSLTTRPTSRGWFSGRFLSPGGLGPDRKQFFLY